MARRIGVVAVVFAGLVSAAQAGPHSMSGAYVGKQGDTGVWSRTVSASNGTYEREGTWSGTNGSGSYQGVGTRGDGSGTFDGTFTRNGEGVGTIQTVTQSTGDGHITTGERTKPDGDTHELDRTRTLTSDGYVITGVNTGANGSQSERQTVDTDGVAVTTITHPDGSTTTSTRTDRFGGR